MGSSRAPVNATGRSCAAAGMAASARAMERRGTVRLIGNPPASGSEGERPGLARPGRYGVVDCGPGREFALYCGSRGGCVKNERRGRRPKGEQVAAARPARGTSSRREARPPTPRSVRRPRRLWSEARRGSVPATPSSPGGVRCCAPALPAARGPEAEVEERDREQHVQPDDVAADRHDAEEARREEGEDRQHGYATPTICANDLALLNRRAAHTPQIPVARCTRLCGKFMGKIPSRRSAVAMSASMLKPVAKKPSTAMMMNTTR